MTALSESNALCREHATCTYVRTHVHAPRAANMRVGCEPATSRKITTLRCCWHFPRLAYLSNPLAR